MSRQRSHGQRDDFKQALAVDEEVDAVATKVVIGWLSLLVPLLVLIVVVVAQQQSDPGEGQREACLLVGAGTAGGICVLASAVWWTTVRSPERWSSRRVIRQRAAQARRYLDVAVGAGLAAACLVLSAIFRGYEMELVVALGPLAVVLGVRAPADRWSRKFLISRRDARVDVARGRRNG